jgi:transcriptional regulator with XRE-family HTH domain
MKVPASSADIEARRVLGKMLADIRIGAGLSQAELAKRCGGKHQMWASRIETGMAGVEPHEAVAWCRACGTHAEMVVGTAARSPEAIYLAERPPEVRKLLVRIARALERGGDYARGRFEKELETVNERLLFEDGAEKQDRVKG